MIKLDHIYLNYGDHKPILEDVSLTLPQGGFYWLTGASGTGKTTFIKMLHMEIKPSLGNLILFDININQSKRKTRNLLKQNIGIIYQDYKLIANLNSYDNIALPLRLQKTNDTTIQRWTDRMIDWMELNEKRNNFPIHLSGGEQQRIAIARAVIHRPNILLADEPTSALDNHQVKRMMELFYDLNELGCTIIIATHNEHLIKQFPASRLYLTNNKIRVEYV